jgi:hypothetical protein
MAFGLLKVVVDLAALAADKTMWGASHNDGVPLPNLHGPAV